MAPPAFKAQSGASASAAAAWQPQALEWTLIAGSQAWAWYGGRLLRVGDEIDGGRVVGIEAGRIQIRVNRSHRTVSLIGPQVAIHPVAAPSHPNATHGR